MNTYKELLSMGFFSNMFSQAKELTKLGNATANIKNMLDQYERDPDVSFLLCAAWICKIGIIDLMVKNHWTPNCIVYVPINGHQTKMYMTEVQLSTISRLKNKVAGLYDVSFAEIIDDILDGGPSFYEFDAKMPQNIRDTILKV